MKILGLNVSVSREPVQKSGSEYPLSAAVWGDDWPTMGPVLRNAYQQVVWVYRAINVLAEQVANIPFRFSVGSAGGDDVITSGPLHEFYARPHPHINRFQYWELRVIWLMLRGECFRVPVYEGPGGRLSGVVLLDPDRFQHVVDNNRLVGWRYTDYSRNTPLSSQVFLPEEVWHEKLPNPFDFWRGLSPLSVAGTAAATDHAASMHMKGVMENNGDVGLILRTSEQLDAEQREQLLAALRERKRRAGTADRPVLLWAGTEVVQPKLSSGDVQFLANRKFSRSEICAAFGVPEEVITATDGAKYDVMAGARLNFIENRVVPLCRRLEAEEEVTVKAIDARARGWFDVEDHPVLTAARRERLTAARAGFDMGVPFNELNRSFDLGFKPLPWGDKGYVPTTMQPADAPAAPTQPAPQP
jgi:HK97 family phage portal protein